MDDIFSKEKRNSNTYPFGSIYFSAFKNGKQTCDRYFVNYFLYLLTSLAVYFYSSNEIDVSNSLKLIFTILLVGLIFAFHMIDNMVKTYRMVFNVIILGVLNEIS